MATLTISIAATAGTATRTYSLSEAHVTRLRAWAVATYPADAAGSPLTQGQSVLAAIDALKESLTTYILKYERAEAVTSAAAGVTSISVT